MKKHRIVRSFISLALSACLLTAGCGGSGGGAAEVAVGLLNHELYGVAAAASDGELVMLMVTRDDAGEINGTSGVIYRAPNGRTAAIYCSANGLPTKILDGGKVYEFSNYQGDKVDVTVDGVLHAGVSIAGTLGARVLAAEKTEAPLRLAGQGMEFEYVEDATAEDIAGIKRIMETGLVAVSVGSAVVIATSGATIGAISLATGGAILDVLAYSGSKWAGNLSVILSGGVCGSGGGCLLTLVGIGADALLNEYYASLAEADSRLIASGQYRIEIQYYSTSSGWNNERYPTETISGTTQVSSDDTGFSFSWDEVSAVGKWDAADEAHAAVTLTTESTCIEVDHKGKRTEWVASHTVAVSAELSSGSIVLPAFVGATCDHSNGEITSLRKRHYEYVTLTKL